MVKKPERQILASAENRTRASGMPLKRAYHYTTEAQVTDARSLYLNLLINNDASILAACFINKNIYYTFTGDKLFSLILFTVVFYYLSPWWIQRLNIKIEKGEFKKASKTRICFTIFKLHIQKGTSRCHCTMLRPILCSSFLQIQMVLTH